MQNTHALCWINVISLINELISSPLKYERIFNQQLVSAHCKSRNRCKQFRKKKRHVQKKTIKNEITMRH